MNNWLHLDIALGFDSYSLTAKADIPMEGITALEGVSGSGKTTLLRSIAGLERRATGNIRFGAVEWLSDGVFVSPQKRGIGYVFQDTRLFKHLDVGQNLAYGHKRAGAGAEVLDRVIGALDLSGLLKRRVGGLSGGEKQRVAIGRALALDPKLLLLDEPMSGLDQARKDEILPYIARAVKAMGCPAIYVSHSRRETAMLADHIMQINAGDVSGPVRCENVLHCHAQPSRIDGRLVLFVADRETRMSACGPQGGQCDVRINEASILLTAGDPGASTALMTLPARLVSIKATGKAQYRLELEGAGWRISITKPKAECDPAKLKQGQSLWLSIMDAIAYPAGV